MRITKTLGLTFIFLLAGLSTVFAQCEDDTGPGSLPGDPDNPWVQCPLDTWVVVLAAAALIFTVIHLYRKQKLELIS
ncbi:MAG: hypothetical protein V4553_13790 [Bacteroidota bacterium]